MAKRLFIFFLVFIAIFVIDQYIKSLFIDGFRWEGSYFSLILVYNKGVAFSMLAFLEEYLKYLQIVLFIGLSLYLWFEKELFAKFFLPIGIIYGAGCSNLYDRFIHQGVVDYVFWHQWFEFAVFNFADVMIDVAIVLILFIMYKERKLQKTNKV
ncbi:signal peptidase II [Sulfurospirillum sp. 1612]|uniref:signal peptidase II n=1 Tax=Sulfurospirillum sp. 1612 TaxID=3094835 RepID=UPI002F94ACA0